MTAAIPPSAVPVLLMDMALERCHTKLDMVSMSRAPAAYNALISPSEWPATKSGVKPADVKMSYVPTEQATVVGCANKDEARFLVS